MARGPYLRSGELEYSILCLRLTEIPQAVPVTVFLQGTMVYTWSPFDDRRSYSQGIIWHFSVSELNRIRGGILGGAGPT